MAMTRVLCALGTRPEAIKMAPVILALRKEAWAEVRVLATAQHRQLLDQALGLFGIAADLDLNIMRPDQALPSLTARLLTRMEAVLAEEKPDAALVQGDTTTVMAVALACFYHGVPVGHVEAGLRTHDLQSPFPEEANRQIASRLAAWHFAPTESARQNLLQEGLAEASITVTGNPVIDALLMVADSNPQLGLQLDPGRRLVLVTAHRRENFGAPFQRICEALRRLAQQNPEVQFLYPVHPNPNVKRPAQAALGALPNVRLCEPLDYAPFVAAMKAAHLILTDSGGVQEEAPALGKPALALRDKTERPEAVAEGVVKVIGTDIRAIVQETQRLLDDDKAWQAMARGVSPYGDGKAASRIAAWLRARLAP